MTNSKLCSHCLRPIKKGKYCSQECYLSYRRSKMVYKQCAQCGKTITRAPKHFARVAVPFCSRTCQNEYSVKENHHAYVPKMPCATCGKLLTRADTTYCCEECVPRTGEHNPKYLERITIPCDQCGGDITKLENLVGPTNFCSMACKNAYHSRSMMGKNNPRYKNGMCKDSLRMKRDYSGFTLKIKQAIRKRDKHTCRLCNMTKEEHDMNMHVHHIDYIKTNNTPENLICLCRFCHGKVHGDEIKWQKTLLRKLNLSTAR